MVLDLEIRETKLDPLPLESLVPTSLQIGLAPVEIPSPTRTQEEVQRDAYFRVRVRGLMEGEARVRKAVGREEASCRFLIQADEGVGLWTPAETAFRNALLAEEAKEWEILRSQNRVIADEGYVRWRLGFAETKARTWLGSSAMAGAIVARQQQNLREGMALFAGWVARARAAYGGEGVPPESD